MRNLKTLLAALLVVGLAAPLWAQSLSGTIEGTIKDEQGGALPGVSVTLTGKTGSRTAVTDQTGQYRFLALDPGTYSVEAQLASFQPQRQDNIVVSIAKHAVVNMTLKVGGVTESVEVVGEAPVVDTTSSATDSNLSQDMLFNLPIRPSNAAVSMLNYLPGVNNGSAYGADSDTANGLLLDGVDTRDPEGGSAWTFFSYNIIEEVQVSGLGAPAEYGAFTGAVVNTITRSGGNRYAGLFEAYYTKASLAGDNVSAADAAANPALGAASKLNKKLDLTAQLSGPIVQDKLFFFASAERYKLNEDPTGPRTVHDEVSPRFNVKLTWQPGPNDHFTGMFQADDYNVIGRAGVSTLVATDSLTNREDAPEKVWGFQWRHLFGSRTFSEVKYTGWTGYFDLNPEVNAPGHYDAATDTSFNSQGWYYYADRGKNQVNASISHYAEGFGKHDLKFGLEIERSRVRSRYGYVDNLFYYDYSSYYPVGQYTAYQYGYDIEGRNQRESVYAQDSWKVNDRLTINPGVRFDWVRGYPAGNSAKGPNGNAKVYDTKNLAPRVGFAFDLTGDSKTVLKAHYGQYYDGSFFLTYSSAIPGIEDFVLNYYSGSSGDVCGPLGNCFTEFARYPSPVYNMDPNIKHPRTDEYTVGLERALSNDVRLSVTGVYRKDKNLQGAVLPDARWTPVTVTNELTGQPLTIYQWANQDASQDNHLLTNPDGFQYFDTNGNLLGTAKAYRKYKSVIFVLDKRFSHRWQGRISYVLAKSEGTVNNDGFNSYGGFFNLYESPSRILVNGNGLLSEDRTHEVKAFLTYQVPVIDVGLNAYYRFLSGRPYAAYERFSSSEINGFSSSGREVFLEPRGSRRRQNESILDLRLEKIFRVNKGHDRLSIYADIQNVFNAGTVTSVIGRYPSQGIAGVANPVQFGSPAAIIAPRQILLGARWTF